MSHIELLKRNDFIRRSARTGITDLVGIASFMRQFRQTTILTYCLFVPRTERTARAAVGTLTE
jgi:hypothetical protein